jgi:hypothetical protein
MNPDAGLAPISASVTPMAPLRPATTASVTVSSTTTLSTSSRLPPIPKEELMELLNIGSHFANRSDKSLAFAYLKYKSYNLAIQELNQLVSSGDYPATYRHATATEVVEIFISKTTWHSSYIPCFSKLANYPLMVEWLEKEDGDEPTDEDVWGYKKSSYSFVDLKAWLELKDKKGKKKQTPESSVQKGGKKKGKK